MRCHLCLIIIFCVDFPTQTQVDNLLVVVVVWLAGDVDFPTQTQVDDLLVVVVVWRAGGVDFPTQTHISGLRC